MTSVDLVITPQGVPTTSGRSYSGVAFRLVEDIETVAETYWNFADDTVAFRSTFVRPRERAANDSWQSVLLRSLPAVLGDLLRAAPRSLRFSLVAPEGGWDQRVVLYEDDVVISMIPFEDLGRFVQTVIADLRDHLIDRDPVEA